MNQTDDETLEAIFFFQYDVKCFASFTVHSVKEYARQREWEKPVGATFDSSLSFAR